MNQRIIDNLFLITWLSSYVLVYYVVARQKAKHVRAQNRLLERCRALLLVGVKHIERGEAAAAEKILQRIRRIESVWRLGNSPLFRWAASIRAVATATLCVAAVRYVPIALSPNRLGTPFARMTPDQFSQEVWTFLLAFLALPLIHALIANLLHDWTSLDILDDCGDRLERLLRSPRGLIAASKTQSARGRHSLDGLTPHEVLGVGHRYTGAEIKKARNRMAGRVHPDLWASANPEDRAAKEEAMKRINAAYDELAAALNGVRGRPS